MACDPQTGNGAITAELALLTPTEEKKMSPQPDFLTNAVNGVKHVWMRNRYM